MRRWSLLAVRLLKPRLPLTVTLTLLCAPALFYVFYNKLEESAAAYPVYVLSAYALLVWCVRVPGTVRFVRAIIHKHPLGNRYLTDLTFRGHLSLYTSTGINFCYALFKLAAGVYYRSFWFGAIAVYYLILTAARALLLQNVHQNCTDLKREYQTARMCGILLFALNLALSAMTIQMVVDGQGYEYPGYLIFVVALYAFYSIAAAVVNLVRFRKLYSPVLSASKVLGLATALVSMLSLQTAMFASFGGAYQFQRLMNLLTGGAVCLLIFLIAVLMVVRANVGIKLFEEAQTEKLADNAL